MKMQTNQATEPARALAHTTTVANEVKAAAIATLTASIERILRMMRECDDPRRKVRLNATLYAASRELAAILRSGSSLSPSQ